MVTFENFCVTIQTNLLQGISVWSGTVKLSGILFGRHNENIHKN